MDTLNRIRRANLRRLIQLNYSSNQSLFARSVGRSESYINRLLAEAGSEHGKNLGEKLTRDIEQKLNLPRSWFDDEGATLPDWKATERKHIHLDTVSSDDRTLPETHAQADDHSGNKLESTLNTELLQISAEIAKLALRLQILVSQANS